MQDLIGRTLGHYRIVEKIGEGGMGEVYRAGDERLDRNVAIKVLPEEVASDFDRLRRFEREAKAVAALNHPNIVTIHSVEEAGGAHFITMELVEGKTLSELIPRKGMPIAKLLGIAIPLANAVSAAHEQGIIHRDLKPDNLMMNNEGLVKILDFGLAKLREDEEEAPGITKLPTQSATQPGRIAGTAAYMSPEQAEGKPIDQRSDIFSLGIVLYEMATGLRPFTGDSAASTLSAILRDTPPSVTELNPALPPLLGRIVRRCLVKDPERRFQNVKDLRNELEELRQDLASGEMLEGVVAAPPPTRWRWALVAAGAAVAAVVATSLIRQPGREGSAPIRGEFAQLTSLAGQEYFPSLSPDGEFLVYSGLTSGNSDIYLLRVGGENALNLTEGSPEDDTQPALSPDGKQIAFRSERQGGGIFVMGATGESVRRLTEHGYNPAWSPDGGEIVFAKEEGVYDFPAGRTQETQLWAIDLSTGSERSITSTDAVQPSWSPHGHRIAYWSIPFFHDQSNKSDSRQEAGQRDIWTVSAAGGVARQVTNDPALDWNPVWSHDGKHLYFSSNRGGTLNLWRVAIDERSGEVLGEPAAVTTPSAWVGHISISRDGRRIIYSSGVFGLDLYRVEFNPDTESVGGPPIPVVVDSRLPNAPDLSPDGQLVAFHLAGIQEDIAIIGSNGAGFRKLTDDPYKDRMPRWSPDGEQITFYSNRSGTYQIWSVHPDGRGLRQLTDGPAEIYYSVWSPDGTQALSEMDTPDGENRAVLWDPNTPWNEQTPWAFPPITSVGSTERSLQGFGSDWSPDGRKVASLLDGGRDIAIFDLASQEYRIVKNVDSASQGWPVVRWLNDGQRMLFLDEQDSTVMLLDIETEEQRKVFSVAPGFFIVNFSLPRSNRFIYFIRGHGEADIWMLTFDEEL
jgi:Tol biopolymer transport system component